MTGDPVGFCRLNDVSSWEITEVRCPECRERVPADEAELHASDHILNGSDRS